MPSPPLSVIIPTRDRAALLARALRSLQEQTLEPGKFEVLVVDSGSSDNTREVAAQARGGMKNLRYFFSEQPGLHAARHLGMEKAQGSVLVYGDDDIRATPTWLEAVGGSFADPQVALVGGRVLPEFEAEPPPWVADLWRENQWGRFLSIYSLGDCGDAVKQIDPTYVWGCNFSIRREWLVRLGGFHPDSMPGHLLRFRGDGELGITRKIGELRLKATYHPQAAVFHFVSRERLTLDYLYARSYRQGISDSYAHIRAGMARRDRVGASARARLPHPARLLALLSAEGRRKLALQRIVARGRREGYLFHQKEADRDAELKKWILQETYW